MSFHSYVECDDCGLRTGLPRGFSERLPLRWGSEKPYLDILTNTQVVRHRCPRCDRLAKADLVEEATVLAALAASAAETGRASFRALKCPRCAGTGYIADPSPGDAAKGYVLKCPVCEEQRIDMYVGGWSIVGVMFDNSGKPGAPPCEEAWCLPCSSSSIDRLGRGRQIYSDTPGVDQLVCAQCGIKLETLVAKKVNETIS